jgi:glycosyltransferase involved in cell wall biosynthesis
MLKSKINLIFFLPSFIRGGAAFSIYKLCKNLNKKLYKIHILCLGKCELKNELKKHTETITELNLNRVYKTFFFLNKFTQKIYNKNKYKTIFISNHHYANVISAMSIVKSKKIKLILTERTSIEQLKISYGLLDLIKKNLILLLVKFTYKKANLVIANSKRESNDIKLFCKCKTKFIYPPSFNKFIKFKRKKNKDNKTWNILTVGSLTKEKGLDTIIKSLKNIKKDNFKLDILGKEYDEKQNEIKYLNLLIKKYKFEKKIIIHGFKKKLSTFYKKADLYINASHIEGFSSATIDAINYNLPIICSDCKGGNREILLKGKGGDLFTTNDYTELGNKLKNFFYNPKILFKKNIIAKKNIKKFSEKINLKNYEEVFTKI